MVDFPINDKAVEVEIVVICKRNQANYSCKVNVNGLIRSVSIVSFNLKV